MKNILEKDMGINYMSKYHSLPHITTIAGKTKDIEKIYKALNKIRIKKFKLKSPGMGIFANQYPNLYIRWEQSMHLKIEREKTINQQPHAHPNFFKPNPFHAPAKN